MKPETIQSILVLYDFTEIAEYALQHALRLARNLQTQITLLHIIHSSQISIEKKDQETQKRKEEEITSRLLDICKTTEKEFHVSISYLIKHGNIFTDIGIFEKEVNARLIVMGTHGSKGIQQFIGSNVVRVIANSSIPFIVVQKNCNENGYKKIVVPVDFSNEIQSLKKWLVTISKLYNSTVYLISNARPNNAIQDLIYKNTENIAKIVSDEKITFSTKNAIIGKDTFAQQIAEFANGVSADMIMIISNQSKGLGDFFLIQNMQKIIMNPYGIAIMCVEPISEMQNE